jgi:hypothetical protein
MPGNLNPFLALLLLLGGAGGGVALRENSGPPAGPTRTVMRPPRLPRPAAVQQSQSQSGGEEGVQTAPPVFSTPRQRRSFRPRPGPAFTPASGCGIERWAVKTLTDPGANQVDLTPKDTTVADLTGIPAPSQPTDRVAPTETTTWRLSVHMQAFKQEADSDIHLALADDAGRTMIAEFPADGCDSGSVAQGRIKQARDAFVAACGQPTASYQSVTGDATIAGVGFFDRIHGQRGVAPNGIELHPVIAFSGACR